MPEFAKIIQPQPPFVAPMTVPQQAAPMPAPMIATPIPLPAPPPPQQQAPIIMTQPPIVPIQTIHQQQQPPPVNGGPLIPLFNPVQMIAVDVPAITCAPSPPPFEQNTQSAVSGQRNGVRALMEIKVMVGEEGGCGVLEFFQNRGHLIKFWHETIS